MPDIPRGIRNNNGGNIRRIEGLVWKGQSPDQTDSDFVQFITPEYGIRAIVRIIRSYKRAGLHTIQEAIDRWSPPTENNTTAYVDAVCKDCGIAANTVVNFDAIMSLLVKAIVLHENGTQPYTDEQIANGIALASP